MTPEFPERSLHTSIKKKKMLKHFPSVRLAVELPAYTGLPDTHVSCLKQMFFTCRPNVFSRSLTLYTNNQRFSKTLD